MADVAAQREARRRKIIQSSEARMNKLLGLTKKQSNESTSQSELVESPLSSQNSLPHSDQNEEQPKSLHLHSSNSTASASLTSRNISSSLTSPPSTDRSSNRPDYLISGQDSATNSISGVTRNIDPALQTPFKRSELEARKTDKLLKDAQGFNAQKFEFVKIFTFIIIAFLQRCVLKWGLGLFVVPSIFVPFVVLEITFEYVVYNFLQHIVLFQSKGNLMSAALMLCGMKQELTETYNNIMARITIWLSDFCLYFFAFIFWDLLIAS
ncbi:unnamed protein product [Candidula unifasciata]|uniref:Calcium signal-modulating cyclophilin ligand n=1 Tax=Candidula unifasciata TaxID=100452 RepID=A0A8S3YJM7_9EUPU|nr:unnamed protein product [Candidula unifasciata]